MEDRSLTSTAAPVASFASLRYLLQAMRPRQWIKNAFVFTALVFSAERLWLLPSNVLVVMIAFVIFCMAASAIYLVNDLVDIEKDRAHPRKCQRPLASGKLNPAVAMFAAVILVLIVLPSAYAIDPDAGFLMVIFSYIGVQGLLYTYWLKNIVILDIITIAAGFVLRTVGGAVVLNITMTPWLIVCMGLLALFLGIGKRRHELVLLQNGAGDHRRILKEYSIPMLDQMISIVTASIVMTYSMTTFSAPVAPKEPYPVLLLTVPFVVYGIFRYLYLIYQRGDGGAPEELVLKDMPLAINIGLWGLTVLVILFVFRNS